MNTTTRELTAAGNALDVSDDARRIVNGWQREGEKGLDAVIGEALVKLATIPTPRPCMSYDPPAVRAEYIRSMATFMAAWQRQILPLLEKARSLALVHANAGPMPDPHAVKDMAIALEENVLWQMTEAASRMEDEAWGR